MSVIGLGVRLMTMYCSMGYTYTSNKIFQLTPILAGLHICLTIYDNTQQFTPYAP